MASCDVVGARDLKAAKLERIAKNFLNKASKASDSSITIKKRQTAFKPLSKSGDDDLFLELANESVPRAGRRAIHSVPSELHPPASIESWIVRRQHTRSEQNEGQSVRQFLKHKPVQPLEASFLAHDSQEHQSNLDNTDIAKQPAQEAPPSPEMHAKIRKFIKNNKWRLHDLFGRLKRHDDDYSIAAEEAVHWLSVVGSLERPRRDDRLLLSLLESAFVGDLSGIPRFHLQRFINNAGLNAHGQIDYRVVVDDHQGMMDFEHRLRLDKVGRRRHGHGIRSNHEIHDEIAACILKGESPTSWLDNAARDK
eukprot:TRINITY_DN6315_c0_g1_i2.p1 TRINITY_DN6315_c0_g1~~TRINITY_DN6315_c0_g1_i2.p1  ORF type:complete len:309 (+),score=44.91 TRINITY_DN6315_c0_g1_i2:111-1037(+)